MTEGFVSFYVVLSFLLFSINIFICFFDRKTKKNWKQKETESEKTLKKWPWFWKNGYVLRGCWCALVIVLGIGHNSKRFEGG